MIKALVPHLGVNPADVIVSWDNVITALDDEFGGDNRAAVDPDEDTGPQDGE